jgi:UDP-N-acetylglucosamine acyltransferase
VGFHVEAIGPNTVGLRRSGYTLADLRAVKEAFRLLYLSGLPRAEVLAQLELGPAICQEIAGFVRSSKRGICPSRRRLRARTSPDATADAMETEA